MGHYDDIKFENLAEIYDFIEGISEHVSCVGCGKPLSEVPHYWCFEEHDGGVYVEEFDKRLWIWVHCSKCGYDNALWKLLEQALYKIEKKLDSRFFSALRPSVG
jgi:hypothetical protein